MTLQVGDAHTATWNSARDVWKTGQGSLLCEHSGVQKVSNQ